MAIKYVAYNENGDRVAGTLEIESPERAQEVLWASNLIVLTLKKQQRLPSLAELMPTFFGVKSLDIITFTRELVSLLESGIALLLSLKVLYEQAGKRALKDAISSVIHDVEMGNSFSQACAKQPSAFPLFYTRLLQVAEETGELRKILLEIVVYMERRGAIVGKIKKALTYPSIVLGMGIVAAVILVTVALPALTGLLVEYEADIPFTTQAMLSLSEFVQSYGKYVFAAIVALALLSWSYIRTPPGKRRWDSAILKVPAIGKIIHHSQMARLCSSLATMLSGGLPTAEAVQLSIEAADNSIFREGLSTVYREILTGSRLAPVISKQKVFSRLFAQTVGIGEETGSLKVSLSGLAAYYEQETERAAGAATNMLEPTIIVVVGAMVGFIGMAIVSAMYSIIPQIG